MDIISLNYRLPRLVDKRLQGIKKLMTNFLKKLEKLLKILLKSNLILNIISTRKQTKTIAKDLIKSPKRNKNQEETD